MEQTTETKRFVDIVKSLVGNAITVVNSESYEGAPVGYTLGAGFYKAKVTGMGEDFLVLVTDLRPAGRKVEKEAAKQYIPLDRIKRVSFTKGDRILHV